MIPTQLKATIFDLDGLIVDTEGICVNVSKGLFQRKFNIELTPEEIKGRYGVADLDFYRKIIHTRKIKAISEELLEEHSALYDQQIENIREALPGVESVLQLLKQKKIKIALCSGSFLTQIRTLLTHIHLLSYFDVIVSCEDTGKHKPDPEPYLLTAQKLGASPAQCLVFEDADNGVRAAKKAGMKCVGVRIGNHGTQNLKEADVVVNTLEEFSFDLL